MTNDKLEDLMYQSGLTAQGCWDEMDEYDRGAIIKLVELVKEDTIKQIMAGADNKRFGPYREIS